MGKVLLVAVLAVVVWWMWRKLQAPSRRDGELPAARPAELMVTCAHCGVNQPRSECVESGGRLYCSEAHRRASEGVGRNGD